MKVVVLLILPIITIGYLLYKATAGLILTQILTQYTSIVSTHVHLYIKNIYIYLYTIYIDTKVSDIASKNLLAFQRLWNRHNPNSKISEDGIYGTQTSNALYNSPCGGW